MKDAPSSTPSPASFPNMTSTGCSSTGREAQVEDPRMRKLFMRMAERSGIEHRWSVLPPAPGGLPHNRPGGFYHGASPATSTRMKTYAEEAPKLALARDREACASRSSSTASPIWSWRAAPASSRRAIDQIIARALGIAECRADSGRLHGLLCGGLRRCAPRTISSAPSPRRGCWR